MDSAFAYSLSHLSPPQGRTPLLVPCSSENAEDGGFTSEILSLGLCWVNMILQVSSFLFEAPLSASVSKALGFLCFAIIEVPRARLLGSPMIWQEWRAHNLIFVLRFPRFEYF